MVNEFIDDSGGLVPAQFLFPNGEHNRVGVIRYALLADLVCLLVVMVAI